MECKYNDNELLYLFSEGIEEALEILLEKYVGLIRKRVSSFKIQMRFRDDFLQEGYMALLIAIRTYHQESPKTFNKYFDLILQRRFIKILKSDPRPSYQNDPERIYSFEFSGFHIEFKVEEEFLTVTKINEIN